ncbi:MAG: hypothetical protein DI551_08230 [Micavibrio aeruginosavorus]|uniref:Uncharacterized protein n=1 Tax=Micavibrio aeruginosavorus TaxID=349221 RepID=A0A2W5N2X9_9BACT|nr:MAG: hypothetical protein DI551_08230 [Micavibrio aeruginosavorus]
MKIEVKAKRNGFRRAGISFSDTESTAIDSKDLKEGELEAIMNDPMLVAVVLEGEERKSEKKGPEKSASASASEAKK